MRTSAEPNVKCKFDALNLTERGLEVEEVNEVDVVQEIVDITDGFGSCQERMADPERRVLRGQGRRRR